MERISDFHFFLNCSLSVYLVPNTLCNQTWIPLMELYVLSSEWRSMPNSVLSYAWYFFPLDDVVSQ